VDGKYLHVKGYDKKIPFIWAFDEYSHDPILHLLAPSENFQAYRALFVRLRNLNYPLSVLVCDENKSTILAVKSVYPKVKVQICLNHYKENIRKLLNVRTNDKHKQFMRDIEGLFESRTLNRFTYRAKRMVFRYGKNEVYQSILSDINTKLIFLTTHYETKCPKTTNMVECFNSHLEGRVKSIKGFESYLTAELWLNAYVMNRRLTKFTDCNKKYKYLNGQAPIQITANWEERDIKLLKEVV
jgi:transposase-like protein